jgi:hypothetical protein
VTTGKKAKQNAGNYHSDGKPDVPALVHIIFPSAIDNRGEIITGLYSIGAFTNYYKKEG